jgi:hypothetical protein
MRASYDCQACHIATLVEIADIDPQAGSPVDRDVAIKLALERATCPRCGARNPATVEQDRRDHRNTRRFWYPFLAAIAVSGYFVPWIAIGFFSLVSIPVVIITLIALVKTPRWVVAWNLAMTAGCVTLMWMFPRYAFVLPAIAIVEGLLTGNRRRNREERWREGAARLRFEV